MASGTLTPEQALPAPPRPADAVEQYIEGRLRHTQRQLQRVDLGASLVTLLFGGLVLLLAAALADHWLIFGGLGFFGRMFFWLAIIIAGGWYAWRRVVPPLARRISPIYAAHTIEQSRPTLKNSLINFLLFRRERQVVPQMVFHALEDRAARDIAAVPAEAGVDAGAVIRRGYLLAAALAVFSLYLVLSPKSPLTSAARVLLPWAKIAPPTRVTITEIKPEGDIERFHGDMVEISATVKGIRDGEPILLYYSTADKQTINQAIPLTAAGESNRYRATLPPGSLGLQQDCTYRLVAGDCKSDTFRIEVLVAPVINVEKLHYQYPEYTGIPSRTVEREGDIRAIANTKVTLHASANYAIQRAEIDLNCTGKPGPKMLAEGKDAAGQITLRTTKGDDAKPEFESYQLRFVDVYQRANPRPIRHRIEILPDLSPEVQLLLPKEEELIVPLDGQVEIRVSAQDRDFALRQVAVRAECDGKDLNLKPILSRPRPEKPHAGAFEGTLSFEPRKLKLRPGDQVTYWAEAEDNQEPGANRATTAKRRFIIAKAAEQTPDQKPNPDQQANPKTEQGQGRPGEGAQDNMDANNKPAEQRPGEAGEQNGNVENKANPAEGKPNENGDGQNSQQPAEPAQPNDAANATGTNDAGAKGPGQANDAAAQQEPRERFNPDTQDSDIVEKLLADAQEQQKKQQGKSSPQPNSQDAKQNQGDQDKKPDEQANDSSGNKGSEGQSPNAGAKSDKQTGEGGKTEPKPEQPNGQQPQSGGEKKPNEANGQKNEADGQKNEANKPKNDGNKPQPGGAEKNNTGNTPQNGNEPNNSGNAQKNGEKSDAGPKPNNGQQPEGGNPAGPKPGEGNAPNRPDPEKPGSQASKQPGGNPQGTPQPGAQGDQGNKEGQTQPNPGGNTDPKSNGGQPKPDQAGGKTDTPQPGDNAQANAGTKPEKSDAPSEPNPGAPQGGNPGAKPQDAGAEKPQQGTANPKNDPTASKPDATDRNEGQMTQPNQSPGSGDGSKTPSSSPEPQSDNKTRPQTPEPSGAAEKKGGAESPSGSKEESKNSKGVDGDQSGGGGKGGGQQSKNPGQGAPGTGTDSESGGAKSPMHGPGETGTNAGNEVATEKKTGNSTERRDGDGATSGERQASDKIGRNPLPDKDTTGGKAGGQANDAANGQPGSQPTEQAGNSRGSGLPTSGGQESRTRQATPPNAGEPGADEGNLDFARKQTNLALEHLKDQMNKEKSDVLKELGWTPDDARRFLEKWEQMQRAAREPGSKQKAAKQQLDNALKSLGLRPRGTEIRGANTARDKLNGLRENIRFAPPAEWAEQVKEYHSTVAGGSK